MENWGIVGGNWITYLIIASDPDIALNRTRRIINGDMAEMSEYPFIVSIQARLNEDIFSRIFGGLEHFCGGTLIAPRWILTAAHCMFAYRGDGKQVS